MLPCSHQAVLAHDLGAGTAGGTIVSRNARIPCPRLPPTSRMDFWNPRRRDNVHISLMCAISPTKAVYSPSTTVLPFWFDGRRLHRTMEVCSNHNHSQGLKKGCARPPAWFNLFGTILLTIILVFLELSKITKKKLSSCHSTATVPLPLDPVLSQSCAVITHGVPQGSTPSTPHYVLSVAPNSVV